MLFIDGFLGVYPTFYRTDLSTIQLVDFLWGFHKIVNRYKLIEIKVKVFNLFHKDFNTELLQNSKVKVHKIQKILGFSIH
jgi:hypothetical protein